MCRARGFLTPTKQGRRGAQMGAELKHWLADRGVQVTEGEES